MPSITSWARLEPRPRAPSLSLAARIRDPLWMLTRQWQFGEFHGADAGGPAFVQLAATVSRFTGWHVEGEKGVRPLPAGDPLEDLVESEPFTADLATRVELGQVFEMLLAGKLTSISRNVADAVRAAIRHAYPLPPLPREAPDPPLLGLGPGFRKGLNTAKAVSASLIKAFAQGGIPLSTGSAVTVLAP